jgi:hypothetical protein
MGNFLGFVRGDGEEMGREWLEEYLSLMRQRQLENPV